MDIIAIVLSSLALLAATAAVALAIYERKRSLKRNAALATQLSNDIAGILGFDPHEALRKQRSENFGGEDG